MIFSPSPSIVVFFFNPQRPPPLFVSQKKIEKRKDKTKKLLDHSGLVDLAIYWISPFTFKQIYERVKLIQCFSFFFFTYVELLKVAKVNKE